jgi:hypothetical protein
MKHNLHIHIESINEDFGISEQILIEIKFDKNLLNSEMQMIEIFEIDL